MLLMSGCAAAAAGGVQAIQQMESQPALPLLFMRTVVGGGRSFYFAVKNVVIRK